MTYNPLAPRPIDWSHEREWRWPYDGDLTQFEQKLAENGIVPESGDVPALDIAHGDDLTATGVIVRSQVEATHVTHDILALVDRGRISSSQYGFVLCSDDIPSASSIRDQDDLDEAIQVATIDLAPFFEGDATRERKLLREFESMSREIAGRHPPQGGEPGGCWLWLLDNTHFLTHALLRLDRLQVSSAGRYLVDVNEFTGAGRGLRQREDMTKELATRVTQKWGIECGYFSVLGSGNHDAVPFYCDDHLDNRMFYNLTVP